MTLLALTGWGYLGWHLWQIRRLQNWLARHRQSALPRAGGIWRGIHQQLHQQQHRNSKRKHKLTSILKKFQKFTKALPDAFVVMDKGYQIEWFNKTAAQLLGLQPGKDKGLLITDLLRAPGFIAYVDQGGSRAESIKILSPLNNGVMLQLHLIPYSEKRHLLIARDITHIHALEQMRRDFVANFSHELRTPLTVLRGFLETMQDMSEPCHAHCRRPLHLMAQQTTRMQNIVNDLLLLSQLESNATPPEQFNEIVDVPRILLDCQAQAQALSGSQQHRIDSQIDANLLLHGNSKELASAFSNLIINAVHYTPPGGNIWIRWSANEHSARLEVQDTGEGIAKQHIPRLTERFYRIDTGRSRQRGGTGLGLAIVKHILQRHHATLVVESRLGVGSVFTCHFPVTAIRQHVIHPATDSGGA